MAAQNGSDILFYLRTGTSGTTYQSILLGTADNFQLQSKDEAITSKASGRFDEALIVSHGATFDVSFYFDSAVSTTYYDLKALADAELLGSAIPFKYGKLSGIGFTGNALITGLSVDASVNSVVSGKFSAKTTGTITPTATLA